MSVLKVQIFSELNEFPTEKRYDPKIVVSELKKKLELITGANHMTMKIQLSIDDKEIGQLDNDELPLEHYVDTEKCKDSTIKLVVKDEQSADLFKGDVPKFEMSKEDYLKRKNNVCEFIKQTREKQSSNQ